MANSRKRISELPPLNVATLDTTFVLGISGSTTYKISINNLTSSLDGAFATDLVTNALSSSLDSKLSTSSFNSYTASFTASVANGTISGSSQISDLGFVTGSYTTINSFNSLTQSFNSISQSFSVISGSVGTVDFTTLATTGSNTFIGNQIITGSVGIRANSGSWNFRTDGTLVLPNGTGIYGNGLLQVDVVGGFLLTSYTDQFGSGSKEWYFHSDGTLNAPGNIYGASNLATTASFNSYTASQSTSSLVDRLNTIENISGSWITESETGSFLTSLSGAISSSSQLTSSYDTRYTLSGSVQPLPSNLLSSSAQITTLGFISSSTTINTGSFATTGSNSFNGNQNITGSLIVSSVAVVNGGITVPTGSILSLTSGSSISVDASGAITGSLTGSVFGIGDVVAFSASLNSRIISGSSVAGTISGSSQLTSSYDSRYSLSGSVLTSFSSSVDSRLDTLEASIITGSPNYIQILGDKRTNITTTGVSLISGSITTTGNPVQIMVTGDANPTSTGWCRLQLHRGESAIGNIVQVENESNQNVPYCLNIIDTPSAGTHIYSMRTVSGIAGTFEFGEASGPLLTAVELNSKTSLPSGTISGSSQLTSSFDTRYLNTGGDGVISGSSQLTSSFDTRYAISASFVSSSNIASIQTITSASYAGLTPVSGTLYIIIG
jgi:hypothetical protein